MTRTIIYSIALLGLFVLNATSSNAQEVRQDLERLYQNFDGVTNLYLELEHRLAKGDEVGLDQKAKLYKKGDLYYYTAGAQKMLVTQQYILLIDDQQKIIVCNTWTKEKAAQLRQQKMPSIEDLLQRYSEVEYQGVQEGNKTYRFTSMKENFYRVDMSFDPKTGFARRVVYHYHPASTAAGAAFEIRLPVVNTNPSFPKGVFSAQQFVVERAGKLIPSTRYVNYTIHDLRQPASK